MKRPEATEYAEYYANYISKVPGSDVLSVLESQRLQMLQLFAGRSERDGSSRYSARVKGRSNLRPDAGMVDVEALIRQGISELFRRVAAAGRSALRRTRGASEPRAQSRLAIRSLFLGLMR